MCAQGLRSNMSPTVAPDYMHEANLEHFVIGCCLDLYHNGSVMTNLNSNLAKIV